MDKISIPKEYYDIALSLAKQRQGRFRNQFTTGKLREELCGDDAELMIYIEGVIGYIGDMCAAQWLGLDPREIMRNMILETDLLAHRDECDLVFMGNRIDVKTEFYGKDQASHEMKLVKVLDRSIKPNETYGCRLINDNQFRENSGTIDYYLFATIDKMDPRKAKYWHPIGWLSTAKAKEIAPTPMWWSPAGARLWTPAHCLPNSELDVPEKIFNITKGDHIYYTDFRKNPRYNVLDRTKFNSILELSNLNL